MVPFAPAGNVPQTNAWAPCRRISRAALPASRITPAPSVGMRAAAAPSPASTSRRIVSAVVLPSAVAV